MYRFFQSGDFGIVSVYFPITYAPCPVTVFKAAKVDPAIPPSQRPPLALTATGSVHCTDPDRIILKRITLTGYPMRVQGVKARFTQNTWMICWYCCCVVADVHTVSAEFFAN